LCNTGRAWGEEKGGREGKGKGRDRKRGRKWGRERLILVLLFPHFEP